MIMIKYCAHCRTPYPDTIGDHCLRLGCEFDVIDIDEGMYAIIDYLTSKNVRTYYSCSGHAYGFHFSDQYIVIAGDLTDTIDRNPLPKGFEYEIETVRESELIDQFGEVGSDTRTIIRASQHLAKKYPNAMQFQSAINRDLASLSRWIEKVFK